MSDDKNAWRQIQSCTDDLAGGLRRVRRLCVILARLRGEVLDHHMPNIPPVDITLRSDQTHGERWVCSCEGFFAEHAFGSGPVQAIEMAEKRVMTYIDQRLKELEPVLTAAAVMEK